ncbi:hypothetical protein Pmani_013877 [Petrolisthes manimaculis]|uniref:Uncharacterized protein n=1 Tax=Petrolisthes manimaculis TaxID=1843537 RepID=A0AAE1PXG2_9EUCA|nr:hypothetical protein Pmani_013877 [Petrolisthes manimaculis]
METGATSYPYESSPTTRPSEPTMSIPSNLFRILGSTTSQPFRPVATTSPLLDTSTTSRPLDTSTTYGPLDTSTTSRPLDTSTTYGPLDTSTTYGPLETSTTSRPAKRRIRRQEGEPIGEQPTGEEPTGEEPTGEEPTGENDEKSETDYWRISRDVMSSIKIIFSFVSVLFGYLT